MMARAKKHNSTHHSLLRIEAKVYIADSGNGRVRCLDLDDGNYTVTTIAGTRVGGHKDGAGKLAQFMDPYALAYAHGRLYVSDCRNRCIRCIDLETSEFELLWRQFLCLAD